MTTDFETHPIGTGKRLALLEATLAGAQPSAALSILAERQRQLEAEGYTPERDDGYTMGQLRCAAAAYIMAGSYHGHQLWPWDAESFKPGDDRRNLEKAGALILAELERMDRAAA